MRRSWRRAESAAKRPPWQGRGRWGEVKRRETKWKRLVGAVARGALWEAAGFYSQWDRSCGGREASRSEGRVRRLHQWLGDLNRSCGGKERTPGRVCHRLAFLGEGLQARNLRNRGIKNDFEVLAWAALTITFMVMVPFRSQRACVVLPTMVLLGGRAPRPLFVALTDLVFVPFLSSGESTPWHITRTEPMRLFTEFVFVRTMGEDGLSFLRVSDLRATQAWSCQGASSYCLMAHMKNRTWTWRCRTIWVSITTHTWNKGSFLAEANLNLPSFSLSREYPVHTWARFALSNTVAITSQATSEHLECGRSKWRSVIRVNMQWMSKNLCEKGNARDLFTLHIDE